VVVAVAVAVAVVVVVVVVAEVVANFLVRCSDLTVGQGLFVVVVVTVPSLQVLLAATGQSWQVRLIMMVVLVDVSS
jgi:hypothetical protein